MVQFVRLATIAMVWLFIANVGLAAGTTPGDHAPVEGGLTSDALALDPVLFTNGNKGLTRTSSRSGGRASLVYVSQ